MALQPKPLRKKLDPKKKHVLKEMVLKMLHKPTQSQKNVLADALKNHK